MPTDPKKLDASHLRQEYQRGALLESDVSPDPFSQFARWFADAQAAGVTEPNAMVLATADADGSPSGRMMLLKEVDARGFVFFSNYTSRKGRELDANPRAALVFFWPTLERQVRVEGRVEKSTRAESERYFQSRPRESQIGAWASQQSQTIPSRAQLESHDAQIEAKFAGEDIPLPDFWGGYRLIPTTLEFWQGRPGRLHDRILYIRQSDNSWQIRRLQP
jgi:pyridoxamine 5'-phosphate oxidase